MAFTSVTASRGARKITSVWCSDVVFSAIPGVLVMRDVPHSESFENDGGIVGQVDPLWPHLAAGETLGLDDVLVGQTPRDPS
jgi:hypothetical protein